MRAMDGIAGVVPRVGEVVAVSGSKITGRLSEAHSRSNSAVEFGGLVKIRTPSSHVFGVVAGFWVEPGQKDGSSSPMMLIELLGEITPSTDTVHGGLFQRGVCRYPRLGDVIEEVTPGDLALIYARPATSNVRFGSIRQAGGLPAFLITDGLLGKHFAVLGTTGTGKSCAVALILRSILERHPNGHVVILDPHNEYAAAFPDLAELISPANLRLPYWMMNADELVALFVAQDGPERDAEVDILKRAVAEARRTFAGPETDPASITVDTPVPFRLGDLARILGNGMGRLTKAESSLPYLRLQARLETLSSDARFAFLFEGLFVKDTMADILARILRVPVEGRPATILDLSGVPSEIVDAVVSLICRMAFDFVVWSAEPQAVPVLLVCEEAHRYIPEDERTGFALARRGIARIAKEGRKYGLSLCLVSQRPSELAATILSQCNTIFALRLSNERDQDFVKKAMPEGAGGLLAALPALHNREAIVVGEGVAVPMRITFDDLDRDCRPRSGSASFAEAWEYDSLDRNFLEETIDRWRRQDRAGNAY
jgi:DNA helicase HerA-like ATPase